MHKKIIEIVLSIVIFTSGLPCAYSSPQNLASQSLFKLWEKKKVSLRDGLIIEARLRAIHRSIMRGDTDAGRLKSLDEDVVAKLDEDVVAEHERDKNNSLKKYPFNYNVSKSNNGKLYTMKANIYKDTYGEEQWVLFYNSDNPPFDALEKFGVKTEEDKEFARRGFWIIHVKEIEPSRRQFLLSALAMAFSGCVFDASGLAGKRPQDAGRPDYIDRTDTDHDIQFDGLVDTGYLDADHSEISYRDDGGDYLDNNEIDRAGELDVELDEGLPPDIIEVNINAALDTGDSPVTLLQAGRFASEMAVTQKLSTLVQFVRDNNAAFAYNGRGWHWELSEQDRIAIIDGGFTYVFNSQMHKVKLIGQNGTGETREIIFNPLVPDAPGVYRINIPASIIGELAERIGLQLNTFNIYFENLEADKDFVLNGFQKQYAQPAVSGVVIPDYISPVMQTVSSDEGVVVTADLTAQGVNINVGFLGEDDGSYRRGGIDISARAGGIDTDEPSLISAWQMNGTDLGIDSGREANMLTNVGGVTSITGRFGMAAQFSGDNYLMLNSPRGLAGGGRQTISAWIKTSIDHGSIAGRWSNANNGGYLLGIGGGRVQYLYGWDVWGIFVESNSIVNDNLWHHVAVTADGDNVRIYIDGRLDRETEQATDTVGANNIDPFMIGQNGNYDWPFSGLIDEVAVYDRGLNSDEIQEIYNQADSSNFLLPRLTALECNVRGDAPFILRLTDNAGERLDIYVLGLDRDSKKSVTIDVIKARERINPLFDLNNVHRVSILIDEEFVPVELGGNIELEIEGLVGIPPTTRHRYATDWHDIDVTGEDYAYLIQNLETVEAELLETRDGIPVIGIKKWQDILLANGLGFTANGRIYSAFTARDGGSTAIYIPHPDLVTEIGNRYGISAAIKRRNSIILGHELDEINTPDHREAVFNEFSRNSINGLNYADVVTVLLETLSGADITTTDENFHRQFIANLLMVGMFLDREGNTYLYLIKQMTNYRGRGDELRKMYRDILRNISNRVSSHRFTHRRLSPEETNISYETLLGEPGYKELSSEIENAPEGTIYVDLARFFVRNDSLASEEEVVAINMEYLKHFVSSVRKLPDRVKVKGIYDKIYQGQPVLEQLISIISEDFGLSKDKFHISEEGVDFSNYEAFLGKATNAVSILTEGSWSIIPNTYRRGLKIVTSAMDQYNRVASSGWEFYAALKGLEYEAVQGFLLFIVEQVLVQLVSQGVITKKEADTIGKEITNKGIAFIPTYYDPPLYYKTIENQKALLTSV